MEKINKNYHVYIKIKTMSVAKKSETPQDLEIRKVKALEKIANCMEDLTVWVEEIDKKEWSNRIQFYLSEFHNKLVEEKDNLNE
jgi:hypothetical protein